MKLIIATDCYMIAQDSVSLYSLIIYQRYAEAIEVLPLIKTISPDTNIITVYQAIEGGYLL